MFFACVSLLCISMLLVAIAVVVVAVADAAIAVELVVLQLSNVLLDGDGTLGCCCKFDACVDAAAVVM